MLLYRDRVAAVLCYVFVIFPMAQSIERPVLRSTPCRVGDDVMMHIMVHGALFVRVHNGSWLQVSGM
jgi:hypothetical protein